MPYLVYILRCADGTYYTGITNDIEKRVAAHNEGKVGAKYTRGRRPVVLVYREACASRGEAQAREAEVKRLSRVEKMRLIAGD